MPIITKAATPLRIPRYCTPKTTWYKKSAIIQLSPILMSPKMVRNAVKRHKHSKQNSMRCTSTIIAIRLHFTRERGEDIDEYSNAGSTDDSQLHIIVEGLSHFIIKQLCTPIKDLHLANKN